MAIKADAPAAKPPAIDDSAAAPIAGAPEHAPAAPPRPERWFKLAAAPHFAIPLLTVLCLAGIGSQDDKVLHAWERFHAAPRAGIPLPFQRIVEVAVALAAQGPPPTRTSSPGASQELA